jgi:hypothetical protein
MPATAPYETETAFQDAAAPTLSELASGILNDFQALLKQQMQMLRSEFRQDLRRTRQVAQCIGLGIFLLTVSLGLLLVAGVHLLASLTGWPMWACWGSVGGFALVAGIVAIVVGLRILKSYNPLPDQSLHALQENVSCLTNRPK